MPLANRAVAALLRTPLHGVLSGSTALVRFEGRRSGRTIETPVQWAPDGDGVVLFVARSESKRWWRNFIGGRDLDVLVRREWRPLHGVAVQGDSDPAEVDRLLDAYLERFPKAERLVPIREDGRRDATGAVLVRCQPRPGDLPPG